MASVLQSVVRDGLHVEVDQPSGRVRMRCDRHVVEEDLDSSSTMFGRRLLRFLAEHESCAGEAQAVITLRDVPTRRLSVHPGSNGDLVDTDEDLEVNWDSP